MKANILLFTFLIPHLAFASIEIFKGNMVSLGITFTNPACVIVKAGGQSPELPVLEPSSVPTDADVFVLEIETQKENHPYIMRSSSINITGLTNPEPDEITLNEIQPSGGENQVPTIMTKLESTNATETDFKTTLFFRSKHAANKYPAKQIQVQTTITIECR